MDLGHEDSEDVVEIKDTVESFMMSHEQRISRTMVTMHKTLAVEIAAMSSTLEDIKKRNSSMSSDISDLKLFLLQSSSNFPRTPSRSRIPGKQRNVSSTKSLEFEVLKDNPSLIVEINAAVNADVISVSLAQTMSSVMDLYHNSQDDTRMTGRIFSILLYGLLNNKSHAELNFGLGRKHTVFRFKAVKRTVVNAGMLSGESLRASAASLRASPPVESNNQITKT